VPLASLPGLSARVLLGAAVALPPIPGERLVVFFTQVAALLGLARLLGAAARRLHQPPVVGELVAGLILGPSVLGLLSPTAGRWFLPSSPAANDLLQAVAELALLVLLVAVGSETDLPLIRSLGSGAAWVTGASLVLPLAAGLVLAVLLAPTLRAPGGSPLAFDLLLAGAIGVSSLPVIGKILSDLGLLRRSFAQLALAAGTANDVSAFLIATVATGLARHGSGHLATTGRLAIALGGLAVLTVLLFSVGQRLLDAALREVRRKGPNVGGSLGVTLVAALVAAALTQALGIEGALGGFLVGVALGRSRFQQPAAAEELDRLTSAVLAPIFFATAGLRADLRDLARPDLLAALAAMLAVGVVSKLASGWLGAWLGRRSTREGTALGVVLNGRGTLQVILAGAGLAAHVFTPATYSAVIVLALVSSLPLAPALQALVRRWPGDPEEQVRLADEARWASNELVRPGRLLLASDGSPAATLAATALHQAWPSDLPVTVLTVDPSPGGRAAPLRTATWPFPGRPVERRAVTASGVAEAVLAEAHLGYGVLGMGSPLRPSGDQLFSEVVDAVVSASPLPVVVARRAQRRRRGPVPAPSQALPEDLRFERILVPISGSRSSQAALELAAGMAAAQRAALLVAHVTPPRRAQGWPAGVERRISDQTGQAVLRDADRLARQLGLRPKVFARRSEAPAQALVKLAAETDADLVVLGATAQRAGGRLVLGTVLPSLLERLETAVITVVLPLGTPPGSGQLSSAQLTSTVPEDRSDEDP